MGAPRSTGGFEVHRQDIDRLAAYVDQITPISGRNTTVDDSVAGGGRAIHASAPAPTALIPPPIRRPFELVDASTATASKVRVVTGDLVGEVPDGFSAGDDPPYILDAANDNVVYACAVWDVSGNFPGEVTSRTLGIGSSVPDDDPSTGTFYYRIGSVSITTSGSTSVLTPSNDAYGPIDGSIYRLWFSNPKAFAVSWVGSDS